MNNKLPVLIQFFATWCHPCKILSPIVDAVEEKLTGKVNVERIDIDSESQIASDYHIQAVPTLVLIKEGRVIWRHTGVIAEHALRKALETAIA